MKPLVYGWNLLFSFEKWWSNRNSRWNFSKTVTKHSISSKLATIFWQPIWLGLIENKCHCNDTFVTNLHGRFPRIPMRFAWLLHWSIGLLLFAMIAFKFKVGFSYWERQFSSWFQTIRTFRTIWTIQTIWRFKWSQKKKRKFIKIESIARNFSSLLSSSVLFCLLLA